MKRKVNEVNTKRYNQLEPLVAEVEAAEILGVSLEDLKAFVDACGIETKLVGGKRFIKRSDLDRGEHDD
jgi:hypothetical protein